ncbi:MAG: DUF2442 domain-containing protein [Sulfuriferula sp.]
MDVHSVSIGLVSAAIAATPGQRQKCELSINGMHRDELDEDISVAGLLAGHGDATRAAKIAA